MRKHLQDAAALAAILSLAFMLYQHYNSQADTPSFCPSKSLYAALSPASTSAAGTEPACYREQRLALG